MLKSCCFPGNVRELKNIIERAACRDTTDEITAEDIGLLESPSVPVAGGDFRSRVETFERQLLSQTLEKAGGNQAAAARSLRMSRDQFRHHTRKLGVISSRSSWATTMHHSDGPPKKKAVPALGKNNENGSTPESITSWTRSTGTWSNESTGRRC
jgi:hypothetical protein